MNARQRLPTVNYVPAKGDRKFWQTLAISAGFDGTLSVDDLSLFGKCISDEIAKVWKCDVAGTETQLSARIGAMSDDHKKELRERASRRACSRAYLKVQT